MSNLSEGLQSKDIQDKPLKSFVGLEFYIADSSWKLSKDIKLDFKEVESLMAADILSAYKLTISFFAVNNSAYYAINLHRFFVFMLRFANGRSIDSKFIIEYRNYLGGEHQYYLLYIRVVLNKWRSLGAVGVDVDAADMLCTWRIKGNVKGDAVKRLDLEQGPLSNIELQGLLEKTVLAYETGILHITETSLLMLAAASARRPIQLSFLKVKDLYDRPGKDGTQHFIVNLPRAKQGVRFRSRFREVEITRELWDVLMQQKDFVSSVFKQYLGGDLNKDDIRELPLFFNAQALVQKLAREEFDQLISGDFFHMRSARVTTLLKRAVEVADVYSERTGELLHINATRLRYTLGSRAAREGYGVLVIAELLDHSDTQNAHVYTLNVPEHAARIDAAVGHQLAPYAHAFAGVLVDNKKQARRGNLPGSDIRDFSGKGTGTCGHGGACGANVPVPCYTCPHFQPWLEGPHELIYVHLIEERDEVARTTGDPSIAEVLDRTILAVAEVIQACVYRKKQISDADEASSHD